MAYDARAAVTVLPTQSDLDLARRVAPVIRFAANEPFLPSKVGITVLDRPGISPSAPLDITFEPGVAKVIEYAIWWDWDIQHLYELEHVWLKLDENDQVIGVDASAHGKLYPMRRADGELPVEEGRVTLYSEPGKHAFHPAAEPIIERRDWLTACCTSMTSAGHVLINAMFREVFADITTSDHRAIRRYLQNRAFVPAYDFTQAFDTTGIDYMSWPELHEFISARVPQIVAQVRADQPLIKAVLLDSGDTLVDEASEIRDQDDHVIVADLIPGAREMVETLAAQGYRIALVADGRVKSFANILGGHGVSQHFEAEIISEAEGCEKPAARMFEAALAALGLTREDAASVVMVGNHLGRDIKGANAMGIVSIWQDWSPRRHKVPVDATEQPQYTIKSPGELPVLLAEIECAMGRRALNPKMAFMESEASAAE
ncbi:HAD family hydrolase [Pelagibacterium sp. 26DY04]|uniref:HAD family hydrolase n=1 Tax=Pelagibacterium sp. 26DY04 TaxID=2967130 RepID=UPI00281525A4|nr:HAD family hydrolase [Pelagibacterium sp. 26DY04]WMT88624.1 HAD family hydrolase [Pelagibacterium sp. 26DY04]